MTLVSPKNSAGYLRAGQLSIELGYQKQAFKIFYSGLKQVPETDENYGLLIQGKTRGRKTLQ